MLPLLLPHLLCHCYCCSCCGCCYCADSELLLLMLFFENETGHIKTKIAFKLRHRLWLDFCLRSSPTRCGLIYGATCSWQAPQSMPLFFWLPLYSSYLSQSYYVSFFLLSYAKRGLLKRPTTRLLSILLPLPLFPTSLFLPFPLCLPFHLARFDFLYFMFSRSRFYLRATRPKNKEHGIEREDIE